MSRRVNTLHKKILKQEKCNPNNVIDSDEVDVDTEISVSVYTVVISMIYSMFQPHSFLFSPNHSLSGFELLILIFLTSLVGVINAFVFISIGFFTSEFILSPFLISLYKSVKYIAECFDVYDTEVSFWILCVWDCLDVLIDYFLYSIHSVFKTYTITRTEIEQILSRVRKQIQRFQNRLHTLETGSIAYDTTLQQIHRLFSHFDNLTSLLRHNQFSKITFGSIRRRFRHKFPDIDFPSHQRNRNPIQERYLQEKYSRRNISTTHQQQIDNIYQNHSNSALEVIFCTLNHLLSDTTNHKICQGIVFLLK